MPFAVKFSPTHMKVFSHFKDITINYPSLFPFFEPNEFFASFILYIWKILRIIMKWSKYANIIGVVLWPSISKLISKLILYLYFCHRIPMNWHHSNSRRQNLKSYQANIQTNLKRKDKIHFPIGSSLVI